MNKLSRALSAFHNKGYRVRVDEETQHTCFYIAEVGLYRVLFHIDYRDSLSSFECHHEANSAFKYVFDTVDKALAFCEDMNKRLGAIK